MSAGAGSSEGGYIDPQSGTGLGATVTSVYTSDSGDLGFSIQSTSFARVGEAVRLEPGIPAGTYLPFLHARAAAIFSGNDVGVEGMATATARYSDYLEFNVSPLGFSANPYEILAMPIFLADGRIEASGMGSASVSILGTAINLFTDAPGTFDVRLIGFDLFPLTHTGLFTYGGDFNIELTVSARSGTSDGFGNADFGSTLRLLGFVFTDPDGHVLDGTASSAVGFTYQVLPSAVPEPGSVLLLATGLPLLTGSILRLRRRSR